MPEKEIEIKLEISKKAGLLRKPVKFVDSPGENTLQSGNVAMASLNRKFLQAEFMKLLTEMRIFGWTTLTRILFTGEFKWQLICLKKK